MLLEDRAIDIDAAGADGSRTLVFRPHDVELAGTRPGSIAGRVIAERRHGASRRLDVEVGMRRTRIEVDVPASQARIEKGDRVNVLPTKWWLFDA
jgi:sulfate transport system ATP-binding protein